jgi:CheY-like chemotaxis protein
MGTLASGIAHDFNNLLTGIQGRISLLALDFEPDSPESEHIAAIEKYICAATGLTRQLLGATHKGKYETASIDVNQVAQSSFKIFGRANKGVSLNEKLCETPLIIDANKGQIEQVFLNIYLNAAQAMPNGGELFLETTLMEIKGAYCKVHQVEQGAYVKISITDTGIGMDNDIRQRVFDPFFTTKERRRGTGLGLASAYGIVKNHGGMITVYSELGHGTTFNIYLPVSNRTVEKEFFPKMMICQGSESILLVDDEKIILDVAKNMLVRLGYCVFVANGGQEALRIISEQGNVIDLVILDLIMPKMDGRETFRRIRKLHPKIPILLSSGYAVNGQAETLMREGCNGFIQKPYSINELSQKVRRILNEIKVKTDSRY